MAGRHVPHLAMGWRRCQLKNLSLEEDQAEPSAWLWRTSGLLVWCLSGGCLPGGLKGAQWLGGLETCL